MKVSSSLILACFLAVIIAASGPGLALKIIGAMWEDYVYPGDTISHEIDISLSPGEPEANFTIEVNGLYQNLEGINLPAKGANDTSPYTARPFLTPSPMSFHLEPSKSQIVQVGAYIPNNVGSGIRYGIISLRNSGKGTSTKGKRGDNTVKVSIGSDIPVILAIADSEMNATGVITDLNADEISARQQNISVIFKNTGNCHYKAKAKASIIGANGSEVCEAEAPLSFSSIVPTFSRLFQIYLKPNKPLERGMYNLSASVELEDGTIMASKVIPIKV